jgi:hypothetical protein
VQCQLQALPNILDPAGAEKVNITKCNVNKLMEMLEEKLKKSRPPN